jgi:hypothetical protein
MSSRVVAVDAVRALVVTVALSCARRHCRAVVCSSSLSRCRVLVAQAKEAKIQQILSATALLRERLADFSLEYVRNREVVE